MWSVNFLSKHDAKSTVFDEFLTYLSAVLSSPSAPKRQEFFGERVSPAAVRRLTTCLTTPVLADALKLVGIAASR